MATFLPGRWLEQSVYFPTGSVRPVDLVLRKWKSTYGLRPRVLEPVSTHPTPHSSLSAYFYLASTGKAFRAVPGEGVSTPSDSSKWR